MAIPCTSLLAGPTRSEASRVPEVLSAVCLQCTSNVSFLFGESIQLRLYIKKNYYTLHRFFHTMVEKVLEPSSSLFSSDTRESLEFWRCSSAPLHFKDLVHWLVHAASLHRRWSNKNFLLARYGVIPVSGTSLDDESAEVEQLPVACHVLTSCQSFSGT